MIKLLILLSTFAIGKIQGQEVIIPPIINVQFLPPLIPLHSRAQPIIIAPDQNWQKGAITTVVVQNSVQRAAYIDQLSTSQGLSPSTVREDALKQSFPAQKPDRMSRPATDRSTATSVGNTSRNDIDNDNARADLENVTKQVSKKQPSQLPEANQNATSADEPLVLPPVVNVTATDPATNETVFQPVDKNGTKVTFDERSSFDGDKCPTGYVKVNGKCVEAD